MCDQISNKDESNDDNNVRYDNKCPYGFKCTKTHNRVEQLYHPDK